jgi:hypothetical protein
MIYPNLSLTAFFRTKSHLDRNIKQAGYMTKDSGQQASYGVPYELLPNTPSSRSTRPTPKTIKKMEDQSQLRMDIKKHNAGSCLRHF